MSGGVKWPAPNCGTCGRFVAKRDPQARYDVEYGDFGSVLSSWPVVCSGCNHDAPVDPACKDRWGWPLPAAAPASAALVLALGALLSGMGRGALWT